MAQLWYAVWNKLSGELDQQLSEAIYREAVGSLFFQRYLIGALTDPCGYGILDDYPDRALHDRLSAVGLVLGKLGCGQMFGEEQRYMMQFNQTISDNIPSMNSLLMLLADGSLVAKNRSEHIRVPNKLYRQSLYLYGGHLEMKNMLDT